MSKHQQQADSEIHEDRLLNFLVNRPDDGVSLNLANNAEIDAEDVYEILIGATADGTSSSTLCNSSEDSPSANTALYHLRPYYGDEDNIDTLYHSEAKRGTTSFYAYATLYARVKNKRYTLAVSRLEDRDTASSVLAEFLGVLNGLDLSVKAVYFDCRFYNEGVIERVAHQRAG